MRCYTDEQDEYIKAIVAQRGSARVTKDSLYDDCRAFCKAFNTEISFSQFSGKYYDIRRKAYPGLALHRARRLSQQFVGYTKSSAAEKEVMRSVKELVDKNKNLMQENKELRMELRKLKEVRQAVENYQKNK
jgi:hypothetical protein